jgi:hypothetical protein
MTGRIRPGVYVLGLIRLRSCGNFGGMSQLMLRIGACPRYFSRWNGPRTARGIQSPSGFRSRR